MCLNLKNKSIFAFESVNLDKWEQDLGFVPVFIFAPTFSYSFGLRFK